MNEITHYLTDTGRDLYQEWLERLNDRAARVRVTARISRLAAGGFGDCKPVGKGVWELRIDYGPGYHVYYAMAGREILLLLLGADKRRQQVDIEKAIACWSDYQQRAL